MRKVKIFSGTNSKKLAEKVCVHFDNEPLNKLNKNIFSDGEFIVSIDDCVRGSESYVIQTINNTDSIWELLLIGDALKRASAVERIACIPYLGYSRQDRKCKPREPIGAKLLSDVIQTAGFTRLITIDIHAEQVASFYNIPVDHLKSSYIFVPYLKQLNLDNIIFATPDSGGVKRVKNYAEIFNTDMVFCYKHREIANVVSEMKLIGDVKGKNVIIVDDLADTCNTICKASNIMMEQGAISVRAIVTHPVLSGGAYNNIEKSALCELITTDTIPLRDAKEFLDFEKSTRKIKILSVSEMIATSMKKIHENESIQQLFSF